MSLDKEMSNFTKGSEESFIEEITDAEMLWMSRNFGSVFFRVYQLCCSFQGIIFPLWFSLFDYKFKSHFYTMVQMTDTVHKPDTSDGNAHVTGLNVFFLAHIVTCIRRQVSESGCYWDHLASVLISEKVNNLQTSVL